MNDQVDPFEAINSLEVKGQLYAKARAERIHLEEWRKSRKAILMKQAQDGGVKTSAAAETEAYADESYIKLLDTIKFAVEEEEKLRWALVSAQAKIEVWRSLCANHRVIDKAIS